MNNQIKEILKKYSKSIIDLYLTLEKIVNESTDQAITETLWAKLPTYSVEDRFIRLIPFKDHINIEARAIVDNLNLITGYKITPKFMIQVYLNQKVDTILLKKIFQETLYMPQNN